MSTQLENNKALIRKFFGAIERGELAVFDQIVSEDYDEPSGRSESRTGDTQTLFHRASLPLSRI